MLMICETGSQGLISSMPAGICSLRILSMILLSNNSLREK